MIAPVFSNRNDDAMAFNRGGVTDFVSTVVFHTIEQVYNGIVFILLLIRLVT